MPETLVNSRVLLVQLIAISALLSACGGSDNNSQAAAPVTPASVDASPGKLLVTAIGLADPSNARYSGDPSLLQADVRADSRSQLVAKTLLLMLDRKSFASNPGSELPRKAIDI